MDESTLRFFEELAHMVEYDEMVVPIIYLDDIEELLYKHLPLLRYCETKTGWELRIGGRREE